MTTDIETEAVDLENWPEDALESLGQCPVCGSTDRHRLFENLVDQNQRCAPGRWTIYRCGNCGCGYLDPRPTPQSIVEAYRKYQTHALEDETVNPTYGLKNWRVALRNGYLNATYGFREFPASKIGWFLFNLLPPPLRLEWDHYARHLPKAHSGAARLLDVGCGNGDFLIRARRAGWKVEGIDFDPKAAGVACSRGLTVHLGPLREVGLADESFDVVTAHQVLEHVHDPVSFLRDCWRLVRPGGRLWIGTPNLQTPVRHAYGSAWQLLDVPRHLVIVTPHSLSLAFERAGIAHSRLLRRGWCIAHMMANSENIRHGGTPHERSKIRPSILLRALWFEFLAWLDPGTGTDLVAVARKPD